MVRWNASRYKIQQIGAPELPIAVQTFVVPLNAKVTGVDVFVKSRSAIDGTFMPYPAQPLVPVGKRMERILYSRIRLYITVPMYFPKNVQRL